MSTRDNTTGDPERPDNPTWIPDAEGEAEDAPPTIWGRYVLEELLRGGRPQLYLAHDTLADTKVVVKVLPAFRDIDLRLAHRELAALRWLDLPGVVRMIDDGPEGAQYVVVMERVQGTHFLEGRGTWEEVAEPVRALLETLVRIHAAGVVHADLKPANVLLTPEGRPVVIDFGVSSGRALVGPKARGAGFTARYASPEQVAGDQPTPQSDLFALGVMLFEWLAGRPPYDKVPMKARWRADSAIPLRQAAPAAPPHVARIVDAMLQGPPSERPQSAREVLEALGGSAAAPLDAQLSTLPSDRASRPQELQALFAGPDAFLHLREDAAAELWRRTGGEPDEVRAELGGWLQAGLIHPGPSGFVTKLDALGRLASGALRRPGAAWRGETEPPEATLWEALARGGSGLLPKAERAFATLRRGELPGYLQRARAVCGLALDTTRRSGDLVGELRWLRLGSALALAAESTRDIELARYEVDRTLIARGEHGELEVLRDLLLAAQRILGGDAQTALEALDLLPELADEDLEIWRVGLTVTAERIHNEMAAESRLQTLQAWASNSPLRSAKRSGWLGNVRYRQERYGEAAELHAKAAAQKRTAGAPVDAVLASLHAAAGASMEVPDLDAAWDFARQVQDQANQCRHPYPEAQAVWILRSVAYRRGDASEARVDLVDAAGHLSSYLQGVFAMNEAAVAWRTGDTRLTVELATLARDAYAIRTKGAPHLLMEAFLCLLEGDADPLPLRNRISSRHPAALRIQTLGLLKHAHPAPPSAWNRTLTEWVRPFRPTIIAARQDIISFEEALASSLEIW